MGRKTPSHSALLPAAGVLAFTTYFVNGAFMSQVSEYKTSRPSFIMIFGGGSWSSVAR